MQAAPLCSNCGSFLAPRDRMGSQHRRWRTHPHFGTIPFTSLRQGNRCLRQRLGRRSVHGG